MIRKNLSPFLVVGVGILAACNLILGLEDATLTQTSSDAALEDADLSVDADLVDAQPPDAAVPTHEGFLLVAEMIELEGLNGGIFDPAGTQAQNRGAHVEMRFTAVETSTPCQGAGVAPCVLGTFPPMNDCHSRVLPKVAPALVSVGDVRLESRNGAGHDAGVPEPASTSIPSCVIRQGEYLCVHQEGTNGQFASPNVFNDADAAFSADDTGRKLVAYVGGSRRLRPITGANSTTQLRLTNSNTDTAESWTVATNFGPTASDLHFLRQTDEILVSYPGSDSLFPPLAQRVVEVGDTFDVTPSTSAIIATLDNQADIAARSGPFLFSVSGTQASGAAGTFAFFEATTATERVEIQCSGLATLSVQIFANHWELLRSRAAGLQSIRIMLLRSGFVSDRSPEPAPPNRVELLAGHGYVLDVPFVPAND
jgi:hypothetical protein